jgi:hypothetical protein
VVFFKTTSDFTPQDQEVCRRLCLSLVSLNLRLFFLYKLQLNPVSLVSLDYNINNRVTCQHSSFYFSRSTHLDIKKTFKMIKGAIRALSSVHFRVTSSLWL